MVAESSTVISSKLSTLSPLYEILGIHVYFMMIVLLCCVASHWPVRQLHVSVSLMDE